MIAKLPIAFFLAIALPSGPLAAVEKQETDKPDWGNLSGQFLYDGAPPEPKKVATNGIDSGVRKSDPDDESLVVHRKSKGIANIFVYLVVQGDRMPTPPIERKKVNAEVEIGYADSQIVPHALTMRAKQTLVVVNHDTYSHNARMSFTENAAVNFVVPPTKRVTTTLEKAERRPVKVQCDIHPWEYAHVLVTDHPYATTTDADGQFEIRDLPVGEWTFQFWHERAGWISTVKRPNQAKPETWPKGRTSFAIKPGENRLGELHLAPELFEPK